MSKYKRKPKDSKCKVCGHEWIKRKDNPKLCPKCKTYKTKRHQLFTKEQRKRKAEYQMKWISLNREKKREYCRDWRRRNPERAKEIHVKAELKGRDKKIEYKARMRKTPRWKYLVYVHASKKRGRKMEITFEQYKSITSKPCAYCGEEKIIGMDRIDSREGYTLGNVVPCCAVCNRMKLAMTVEEFMDKCRAILKHYDRSGADFGGIVMGDLRF